MIAYRHGFWSFTLDSEQVTMSDLNITTPANNKPLRRWMLVINNPTFQESEQIWNLAHGSHISGLMWSAEHAHDDKDNEPRNDTEHYHIYMSFKNPVRMTFIKNLFPRAHIEPAHKPALACCRYVAKEGFYMSFGSIPDVSTGCKNGSKRQKQKAEDLAREEVVKKIRNGQMRFQDLSDEQLLDTKLVRAAKDASSMTQGPMRPEVYICCFVSPTGWGKSYSVWETFQRVASVEFGASQEWFLDAEQEVMLFDEFCGQVRAQKMLKYLDCYPISLPIKGGHRPCYWKLIFICSNTPPDEWYMKDDPKTGMRISSIPEEVRKALYRRIGYPVANARGETHVYNEAFTSLLEAQKEMKQICVKLHERLYPKGVPEDIREEDPDKRQQEQEKEREQIKELAELHGINLEEEEHRWDRARQIQREREEHEYDDMPELEYIPPSSNDPEAIVPEIEELEDEDSCQDPPDDDSDMN